MRQPVRSANVATGYQNALASLRVAARIDALADPYGRFEYWANEAKVCSVDDHGYERDRRRDGQGEAEYGRGAGRRPGHLETTPITSVRFSDDPAFQPGRGTRPTVDSVNMIGTGRWNGRSGYRFEATATDQGEPGRGRDTLSLTVWDAAGRVVATVSGVLAEANIRPTRLRR